MPAANRNNLGGIKKPSSPSDFKKKKEPIELPSGKCMVLKPTSVAGFLQTGSIPNSLMQVMQAAMSDKTGEAVDDSVRDLMTKPESLNDLFEAVDAFVISVALEPRVHPAPEDEADRDDNLLYIDEIDMDDKMFIFTQAVGGNGGVEPFRAEPTGGVGAVPQRKAVGSTTKRSPRSKA